MGRQSIFLDEDGDQTDVELWEPTYVDDSCGVLSERTRGRCGEDCEKLSNHGRNCPWPCTDYDSMMLQEDGGNHQLRGKGSQVGKTMIGKSQTSGTACTRSPQKIQIRILTTEVFWKRIGLWQLSVILNNTLQKQNDMTILHLISTFFRRRIPQGETQRADLIFCQFAKMSRMNGESHVPPINHILSWPISVE